MNQMSQESTCNTCGVTYWTSHPRDRFVCDLCVSNLRTFYGMFPHVKPKQPVEEQRMKCRARGEDL